MTTRLRWFEIEPVGVLLRILANPPAAHVYGARSATGFVIERADRARVEGIFVQRVVDEREVVDPLGRSTTSRWVEIRETQFAVTRDFPQLQIANAPRSISDFLGEIGVLAGYGVVIEQVTVDVLRTIDALERRLGRAEVNELVVRSVPVSPTVFAHVVLTGAADVRSEAHQYLRGGRGEVASASLSFKRSSGQLACSISRTGVVTPSLEASEGRTMRDAVVATLREVRETAPTRTTL